MKAVLGSVKKTAGDSKRREERKQQVLSASSPYEVLGLDDNSTCNSGEEVKRAYFKVYYALGMGSRDSDTDAAILRLDRAKSFLLDEKNVAAYKKYSEYFCANNKFGSDKKSAHDSEQIEVLKQRVEKLEAEVHAKQVELSCLQDTINTKCKQIAKLSNCKNEHEKILANSRKELEKKISIIKELENDFNNLNKSNQKLAESRNKCLLEEEAKVTTVRKENSQLRHEIEQVRRTTQDRLSSSVSRTQELERELTELRHQYDELDTKFVKTKYFLAKELNETTAKNEELEEELQQVKTMNQQLHCKLDIIPEKTKNKLLKLEADNASLKKSLDTLNAEMAKSDLEHNELIKVLIEKNVKLRNQKKDLVMTSKNEISGKNSIIATLELECSKLKETLQDLDSNVNTYFHKKAATVKKLKDTCAELQHLEHGLRLNSTDPPYNELSSRGLAESRSHPLGKQTKIGSAFRKEVLTVDRKSSSAAGVSTDECLPKNEVRQTASMLSQRRSESKSLKSKVGAGVCSTMRGRAQRAGFKGVVRSKERSQAVNATPTKYQRWAERIKQNQPDRLTCAGCNKQFSTTCNLTRHMKSRHDQTLN